MAPTPRESWSDQRLDDLNQKVGDGFLRVEKRIDKLETKVDAIDQKVGALPLTTRTPDFAEDKTFR